MKNEAEECEKVLAFESVPEITHTASDCIMFGL